mgnify:CR=1 FL=1
MVSLIEIGACIQGLWVADRFGTLRDVVLGYDTAAEYEANPTFFGAALGRLISRMPDCILRAGTTLSTISTVCTCTAESRASAA